MKWKYILPATAIIYVLRGDEWVMYFAAYAEYCFALKDHLNFSDDNGSFMSCFSNSLTRKGG